jgi:DNA-binding GntR family transcriptional regulator
MTAEATRPFTKLTSRSRADVIADQLRDAIARGALSEGQQLTEVELATDFGVSRGSIREAMQRLVQEGLLIAIPNRGMFVTEISPDDVIDLYNARRAIEASAALALLSNPQPAVLESLKREYESMTAAVRSGSTRDMTAADQRFHEALVDSLRNRRLERMAQTFLVETRLCLTRLEGKYELPQEAVDEHLGIIQAIESGTALDVLEAINIHMDNAILLLTGNDKPQW